MISNPLIPKPHYVILDGLRGVAALLVVAMHLFEAHATTHLDLIINHAYLAVDFFFLLSGFVIGYAYDNRWNYITTGAFFTRRLVRLQPMVVLSMVIGALLFYFQESSLWPLIKETPVWMLLLMMVIGFTLLPVPPSMDIRGWSEMHPLNGPAWTLFFEYVANILYATLVRKFSNLALSGLVFCSGCLLLHLAVTSLQGDVIGGWAIDAANLHIGFARLLYPFFGGLLLYRVVPLASVRNAFLWCSLILVTVLAMPRIGGSEHLWLNGLYEALTILVVFPVIVYLGASGEVNGKRASIFCRFLGDISYPLYITHYPLVYTYTAWVNNNKVPVGKAFPILLFVFLSAIVLAYVYLKLYDEPVRKWLNQKLFSNLPKVQHPAV